MLERFIEENLYKTEEFIRIPAKEVYVRYSEFCRYYKFARKRKKEFYSGMAELGVIRHERTPTVFAGWYIKPCKY